MGRIGHCSPIRPTLQPTTTYRLFFLPWNVPIGCILPPILSLELDLGWSRDPDHRLGNWLYRKNRRVNVIHNGMAVCVYIIRLGNGIQCSVVVDHPLWVPIPAPWRQVPASIPNWSWDFEVSLPSRGLWVVTNVVWFSNFFNKRTGGYMDPWSTWVQRPGTMVLQLTQGTFQKTYPEHH